MAQAKQKLFPVYGIIFILLGILHEKLNSFSFQFDEEAQVAGMGKEPGR